MKHDLDKRELATILASLRHWQATDSEETEAANDIANDHGAFDALSNVEIDGLCERINVTDAAPCPVGHYSLPITKPNTTREGLWNVVQMIINDIERGDAREALLRAVDLRSDISSKSNPYKIPGAFSYAFDAKKKGA
jgi:hypothetical protein